MSAWAIALLAAMSTPNIEDAVVTLGKRLAKVSPPAEQNKLRVHYVVTHEPSEIRMSADDFAKALARGVGGKYELLPTMKALGDTFALEDEVTIVNGADFVVGAEIFQTTEGSTRMVMQVVNATTSEVFWAGDVQIRPPCCRLSTDDQRTLFRELLKAGLAKYAKRSKSKEKVVVRIRNIVGLELPDVVIQTMIFETGRALPVAARGRARDAVYREQDLAASGRVDVGPSIGGAMLEGLVLSGKLVLVDEPKRKHTLSLELTDMSTVDVIWKGERSKPVKGCLGRCEPASSSCEDAP